MNVEVIKINWSGPYTADEAIELDGVSDCGLYQIYGAHPVYGAPALLYIGQCDRSRFSTRIAQHQESWMKYESARSEIYVGRICDVGNASDNAVGRLINDAERLLIYFCAPAYNSEGLKRLRLSTSFKRQLVEDDPKVLAREAVLEELGGLVILNFGRRFLLPQVCTSLVESECEPLEPYCMQVGLTTEQ